MSRLDHLDTIADRIRAEWTVRSQVRDTTLARFLNAPDAREVIFVRNATEAINLVAYAWGRGNIGRAEFVLSLHEAPPECGLQPQYVEEVCRDHCCL